MDNPETRVFSVSELNGIARRILEAELSEIWIEGELSNLAKPSSGHLYFTLKDSKAQIRCAMFRNRARFLRFNPDIGMTVRASGRISLYEPRGDYQLIVEALEPAGEGALQRAYEQLKQKLWRAGLFAEEEKKALPPIPLTVGIITSPSGAAIHDILHVLERRFPLLQVIIYPVQVQGDAAAAQLTHAVRMANERQECDLLIITRGGGSLEDLWSFNSEEVAHAIHDSNLPVVSAVGHEIDFTITDFVADVRAPTPSAAAELISPEQNSLLAWLEGIRATIITSTSRQILDGKTAIDTLERRLQQCNPETTLQRQAQRLDNLEHRLRRSMDTLLERMKSWLQTEQNALRANSPRHQLALSTEQVVNTRSALINAFRKQLSIRHNHLESLTNSLLLLNPQQVLGRGYAIITQSDSRSVASSATQLEKGDDIDIHFADGIRQGKITR